MRPSADFKHVTVHRRLPVKSGINSDQWHSQYRGKEDTLPPPPPRQRKNCQKSGKKGKNREKREKKLRKRGKTQEEKAKIGKVL